MLRSRKPRNDSLVLRYQNETVFLRWNIILYFILLYAVCYLIYVFVKMYFHFTLYSLTEFKMEYTSLTECQSWWIIIIIQSLTLTPFVAEAWKRYMYFLIYIYKHSNTCGWHSNQLIRIHSYLSSQLSVGKHGTPCVVNDARSSKLQML